MFLDFGCGNGYAGEIIKTYIPGSSFYLLIFEITLERETTSYNDFFSCKDGHKFAFTQDNFFDFIFSLFLFFTLEYPTPSIG